MVKVNPDEQVIAQIFDAQPDSVVWFHPIFTDENSKETIVDFEVIYCNKAAAAILQVSRPNIIGSRLLQNQLMDEESRKKIFEQCYQTWQTGEALEFTYYSPGLERYFNVQRSKVQNGILSITRDRTREVKFELEKESQAKLLSSIIESSPYGIILYEAMRDANNKIYDFRAKVFNAKSVELGGFHPNEISGCTLKEILRLRKNQDLYAKAVEVVESSRPYVMDYYSPAINRFIQFHITQFEDGFLLNYIDISQLKNNEQKIEEQKDELKSILDASINSIIACEAVRNDNGKIVDFRILRVNAALMKLNPLVSDKTEGQTFLSLFPHTKDIGIFEAYCSVIETGKGLQTEMHYNYDSIDGWFEICALKRGKNGLVITFSDVTVQRKALSELERQKTLLNNILQYSSTGISVTEVIRDDQNNVFDGRSILVNDAAATTSGISKEILLSKTSGEIEPGILQSPIFKMTLDTLRTGNPFQAEYFLETTSKWLSLNVSKLDDDHLINVITDISESKKAQLQLQVSAEKLHTVINTSQAGFFLGSPVLNEQNEIVDFRFTLVNQVLASFVNKQPSELIGELGSDWFVQYKENGLFEKFKFTYEAAERQQFDIHYLGLETEVWANVMCTKIGDELLGSFTDFTLIKRLQLQLEKSVEDLKRSNESLNEFAYAASHDLQEPLRKISYFSGQVLKDLDGSITPETKAKLDRMLNATERMKTLIDDLLSYSQVSVKTEVDEDLELNEIVASVLQDLEAPIAETGAIINVSQLPNLKGDERQIRQMFQNIIGNSLKYRKPNSVPEINISSCYLNEKSPLLQEFEGIEKRSYYLVEISDNGIGFKQDYAEKIFQVFQRLHNRSEYEGTGVGLAIVQKVVTNHKGVIKAESSPGNGARFKILFPAN